MADRLRTRLWHWRVANGLTLAEVSGLTGLSESMLSRAETGEREIAPLTKVRVARRLGVHVVDLFEVDEVPDDVAGVP